MLKKIFLLLITLFTLETKSMDLTAALAEYQASLKSVRTQIFEEQANDKALQGEARANFLAEMWKKADIVDRLNVTKQLSNTH